MSSFLAVLAVSFQAPARPMRCQGRGSGPSGRSDPAGRRLTAPVGTLGKLRGPGNAPDPKSRETPPLASKIAGSRPAGVFRLGAAMSRMGPWGLSEEPQISDGVRRPPKLLGSPWGPLKPSARTIALTYENAPMGSRRAI